MVWSCDPLWFKTGVRLIYCGILFFGRPLVRREIMRAEQNQTFSLAKNPGNLHLTNERISRISTNVSGGDQVVYLPLWPDLVIILGTNYFGGFISSTPEFTVYLKLPSPGHTQSFTHLQSGSESQIRASHSHCLLITVIKWVWGILFNSLLKTFSLRC